METHAFGFRLRANAPEGQRRFPISRLERGELLPDHVIITVKDLDRSIAFYETALKPLGSVHALDYDGKNGPEGHPDLKGFGRDGRVFFWLRQGGWTASARVGHERAKLSVSACRF